MQKYVTNLIKNTKNHFLLWKKIQKHRKWPALLRTPATSNWEIICCPATLRWSGVECGAARSHGKTWQLKISDSLQGCHLAVSDESVSASDELLFKHFYNFTTGLYQVGLLDIRRWQRQRYFAPTWNGSHQTKATGGMATYPQT